MSRSGSNDFFRIHIRQGKAGFITDEEALFLFESNALKSGARRLRERAENGLKVFFT
jgi:hypothetical protein